MRLTKTSLRDTGSISEKERCWKVWPGVLQCLCGIKHYQVWVSECEIDNILGSVFFLIIPKVISGDEKFTAANLKAFSKLLFIKLLFTQHLFEADFTFFKNYFKVSISKHEDFLIFQCFFFQWVAIASLTYYQVWFLIIVL